MPVAGEFVVSGVDTSLTTTGVVISTGTMGTVGTDGITVMPWPDRFRELEALRTRIWWLIRNSNLVVIEQPSLGSKGGGNMERVSLFWKVAESCVAAGIPTAIVPPTSRAKYATGKGNASKFAVVDAVARRFPSWITSGDNNLADALVLMAMGLDAYGVPLEKMPATHRVALEKIQWPELVNP